MEPVVSCQHTSLGDKNTPVTTSSSEKPDTWGKNMKGPEDNSSTIFGFDLAISPQMNVYNLDICALLELNHPDKHVIANCSKIGLKGNIIC